MPNNLVMARFGTHNPTALSTKLRIIQTALLMQLQLHETIHAHLEVRRLILIGQQLHKGITKANMLDRVFVMTVGVIVSIA